MIFVLNIIILFSMMITAVLSPLFIICWFLGLPLIYYKISIVFSAIFVSYKMYCFKIITSEIKK